MSGNNSEKSLFSSSEEDSDAGNGFQENGSTTKGSEDTAQSRPDPYALSRKVNYLDLRTLLKEPVNMPRPNSTLAPGDRPHTAPVGSAASGQGQHSNAPSSSQSSEARLAMQRSGETLQERKNTRLHEVKKGSFESEKSVSELSELTDTSDEEELSPLVLQGPEFEYEIAFGSANPEDSTNVEYDSADPHDPTNVEYDSADPEDASPSNIEGASKIEFDTADPEDASNTEGAPSNIEGASKITFDTADPEDASNTEGAPSNIEGASKIEYDSEDTEDPTNIKYDSADPDEGP